MSHLHRRGLLQWVACWEYLDILMWFPANALEGWVFKVSFFSLCVFYLFMYMHGGYIYLILCVYIYTYKDIYIHPCTWRRHFETKTTYHRFLVFFVPILWCWNIWRSYWGTSLSRPSSEEHRSSVFEPFHSFEVLTTQKCIRIKLLILKKNNTDVW